MSGWDSDGPHNWYWFSPDRSLVVRIRKIHPNSTRWYVRFTLEGMSLDASRSIQADSDEEAQEKALQALPQYLQEREDHCNTALLEITKVRGLIQKAKESSTNLTPGPPKTIWDHLVDTGDI